MTELESNSKPDRETEENNDPVLECKLKYILTPGSAQAAQARAELAPETLSIMPDFGPPLLYSLRDIRCIAKEDFRLRLDLAHDETLELFHLGHSYDDFARILNLLRNELKIQDMLMQETVRIQGIKASFSLQGGSTSLTGQCELRLYETALVVLPEFGEPVRIPYSGITAAEASDYTLTLDAEPELSLTLSQMGTNYDYFTRNLSAVMNELSLKAQELLKDLLPQAPPAQIRAAAQLMREGKAAARGELDAICPGLWPELEKRLELMAIKDEYDFLSSRSLTEKISIGFKRGLMGDLTGEYIWFLVPVWKGGNAVAMEAASGTGSGRATYFFRLTSRSDYDPTKPEQEVQQLVERMIKQVNQGMLAINFRREPIYLPEASLANPRFEKYRHAIPCLPALQELRSLFIGRVFHRTREQWEQDVNDLLAFNTSTRDDNLKWSKADASSDEEELEHAD